MATKTNSENATETQTKRRRTTTSSKSSTKTESTATASTESKDTGSVETVKARQYNATDFIPCRSVTSGQLVLRAKSGELYTWYNSGDITEVEYQDLRALKASKSNFIFAPYFIIDDSELIEQWTDVKQFYDTFFEVAGDGIDQIFNLPANQFESAIKNIPAGLSNSIKSMAVQKIQDGTLDSIKKIAALENQFNIDLKCYLSY